MVFLRHISQFLVAFLQITYLALYHFSVFLQCIIGELQPNVFGQRQIYLLLKRDLSVIIYLNAYDFLNSAEGAGGRFDGEAGFVRDIDRAA